VSNNQAGFNLPQQLNTAVLFLVFNRLDTTRQVFEAIKLAKPPRLYIASDGARSSRDGEDAIVQSIRDYVLTHVNWDCEVKTLFREKNLGCKYAVSGAIDWFFEHEEMGVILEDDCLPDASFFQFCQELLELYRYDQRIGIISGDNFQFGNRRNDESYYFSKYVHIWGWASWRDRWAGHYDVAMTRWPRIRDEGWLLDIVGNPREADYWENIFGRVYRGEIDTWDYQWVFANFLGGRLNIMPNVNMISNIGFNDNATHTTVGNEMDNMTRSSLDFPLVHPLVVSRNMRADERTGSAYIRTQLLKRVFDKFMRHLR
jgi:hypothetical protein